jgi:hypothetical protein
MPTVSLDYTMAEKFSLPKRFSWRDAQINCTLAIAQPSTNPEYVAVPDGVGHPAIGLRATGPLRSADVLRALNRPAGRVQQPKAA